MSSPIELLLQPKNWALLQHLQAEQDAAATPLPLDQLNKALRQTGLDPQLVSAVLTQLDLRRHAQTKFGDTARHMLLTRAGLEQATRMRVAALRAQRFVEAGMKHVVDMGCGIGADSLAFAMLGLQVTAIDADSDAVACCATNLRAFTDSEVLHGDLRDLGDAQLKALGADSLFLDPARRDGSGRKQNPQDWSPPWSYIEQLWDWPYAKCVKVAPGIKHQLLPEDACAQWVSVDGALVEAAIWSPQLSPAGSGRQALVLDKTGAHQLTDKQIDRANAPLCTAPTGTLQRYLAEPDAAVIRAGLVNQLCTDLGGALIDPKIAYITTDERPASPFATGYEVLETTTMKLKQVQRALQRLNVGRVEVKKRGADIDPAIWQRKLNGQGEHSGVVFLTQSAGTHLAIVARRITS